MKENMKSIAAFCEELTSINHSSVLGISDEKRCTQLSETT